MVRYLNGISIFQLLKQSTVAIIALGASWICVTAIQNDNDALGLLGFLLLIFCLFSWVWDRDEERKQSSFWKQYTPHG